MSRGSELYNAANTLQVATTVGGTSIPTASIVSGVYKVNAYFNNGVTVLPAGDYAVTVTTTLVAN
jgi:hypothetical protein